VSEVVCNGCRSEITGGEWITLYPPIRKAEENYHYACWQTGWYTGIEPKGEWPVGAEQAEPVFDHIKGDPSDPVNSPSHYRWLPNGIEVIDITETLNFTMGNAVKYILRADHKGKPIEDLRKAAWYIEREIARRESGE
jgi:hypothetical protein